MKKALFRLLLIIFSFNVFGQNDDLNLILEDEDLSLQNNEELLEALELFNNGKNGRLFNINNLSSEEMILLGLNNFQIFCLENYIQQSGQMLSLNELRFVNGFDSVTIERIRPFLYAEAIQREHPLRLDSIVSNSEHSLRFQYKDNLHSAYGYRRKDNKGYLGEKFSSSLRYKMQYYDRAEFSFVADKDAGEPLYYKNKTLGYDHYNISLSLYKINKYVKQITIGDYRLSLGEGLAIRQNFDVGYFSRYGIKRSTGKITPFRSSSEYNYNRGAAIKMNFKGLDVFAFASYNPLDFNGTSIQQTGYHRTEKEISYKDSLHQTMGGLSLQYVYKGLQIGSTFLKYGFSDSITPNIKSYPYQKYYFSGKKNGILSFNLSYSVKKLLIFSELARSGNNAYSYIAGAQYNFGYKTSLSLSFRNYDTLFQNFYANAIGVHSLNNNERGFYADFSRYVNKKFSYYIGADCFYFPFISYRASTDVKGQKAKLQINYDINGNHSVALYSRYSNRYYDFKIDNKTKIPMANTIGQVHLQYKCSISDNLSFTLRSGYSHSYTPESESNEGKFFMAESMLKVFKSKLSLRARYTVFNTMDYDNRFYLWEYSLPLSYSSSVLNGKGQSFYLLASYSWQNIQFFIKYSIIKYSDREEISSGNDKISSNNNQFISSQIFIKL